VQPSPDKWYAYKRRPMNDRRTWNMCCLFFCSPRYVVEFVLLHFFFANYLEDHWFLCLCIFFFLVLFAWLFFCLFVRFVIFVFLWFCFCFCLFLLWGLSCLSFCEIQLLITSLISLSFPSILPSLIFHIIICSNIPAGTSTCMEYIYIYIYISYNITDLVIPIR
jgi:hypothetical protein